MAHHQQFNLDISSVCVSDSFAQLKRKARKAHLLGHCFSTKPEAETVDFDAAGGYGGIIVNGVKPNKDDMFDAFKSLEVHLNHAYTLSLLFPHELAVF